MNSVPVAVVSRPFGHADVGMTPRYAHLGDREVEQAAERVGQAVARIMGRDGIFPVNDDSEQATVPEAEPQRHEIRRSRIRRT